MTRIMAFADLHFHQNNIRSLMQASARAREDDVSSVVIAGDVSDGGIRFLFAKLAESFDVPVVFCLGNHEFARHGVEETLAKCREQQSLYLGKRIFCLDVCGIVSIDGVTYGGNVLWYDGTLGTMTDEARKRSMEHVSPHWLDSSIIDFHPAEENRKCVERLMPLKDAKSPRVLVTHTVPHKRLNQFEVIMPDSPFNIYSGMSDLLSLIRPDVAICGHTHKRVVEEIDGCRCFNIGSDYIRRDTDTIKKEIIEF